MPDGGEKAGIREFYFGLGKAMMKKAGFIS